MDLANTQQPLHIPNLGFQLLHYRYDISSPGAPPMTHHLGIFTSLEHAQAAARYEFDRILADFLTHGYYGRCFKEIDLNLRGLITAYVDVLECGEVLRRELFVSEFHIRTVEVRDPTWEAEVHRVSQDTLFHGQGIEITANKQVHRKLDPTAAPYGPVKHAEPSGPGVPLFEVRMPERSVETKQPDQIPKFHFDYPPPGIQHEEERSPEWARTRIPILTRRDDGPFRRAGDPPYAERMSFSPPNTRIPASHSRQQSGGSLAGRLGITMEEFWRLCNY